MPVVWIRSPPPAFGQLCEGVRLELGQDGLIVLVGKDPRVRLRAKARIVVLEISCDPRGDLQLTRALDELNPNYRAELLTSPRHDFDHVYLTLATKVGKHHVVIINGEEVPACRHSDLNFLRLLLLATGRKSGENNGAFQLDALRAGNNPHRPILALRNDLNKCKAPNVTKAELGALVHVEGGEIRLRIPPRNIEFDSSLGELACIGATSRPSSNAPKGAGKKGTSTGSRRAIPDGKADSLAAGRATAELLLSDCRRQLEKPAALEVPPTPSSGQRVSFGAKR